MTTDKPVIDHKARLTAASKKAAREAARQYQSLHPEAAGLRLHADIAAIKPRPKEMRDYAVRAVRLFLGDRKYVAMTNAALAAYLSADIPHYEAPSNLLTVQFTSTAKKEVAAMLRERNISIDLNRIDTPSKVKAALTAHYKGQALAEQTTARVSITSNHVIVNNRAYPINGEGRLGRIQVGKGKLNVETLRKLLFQHP